MAKESTLGIVPSLPNVIIIISDRWDSTLPVEDLNMVLGCILADFNLTHPAMRTMFYNLFTSPEIDGIVEWAKTSTSPSTRRDLLNYYM